MHIAHLVHIGKHCEVFLNILDVVSILNIATIVDFVNWIVAIIVNIVKIAVGIEYIFGSCGMLFTSD